VPRLEDLPGDVVATVLLLLPLSDRGRCACVCRAWRQLTSTLAAAWSVLDFRQLRHADDGVLRALTTRARGELVWLACEESCLAPGVALQVARANSKLQFLRVESRSEDRERSRWTSAEAVACLSSVTHLQASLFLTSASLDGVPALLQAGRLCTLRLERCLLEDAEATVLAEATANSAAVLEHLSVRFNSLGPTGCQHLAHLAARGGLRSLQLGFNPVGDSGVRALAAVLHGETCRMQHLDLRHCGIHSLGAVALAAALPGSKLETLVLEHNHIGQEGASSLGAVLQLWHSCPLRHLNVSSCDIGPGVAAFSAKVLSRLTHLYLAFNSIHTHVARTLAHALAHNTSLVALDVSRNALMDEGVRELCVALRTHPALQELHLGQTAMTREGARRVAGLVRNCPKLRFLDVSGNALERSGGCVLATALEDSCGSLGELVMASTQVDDTVAYALARALWTPGGRSMSRIVLDDNVLGNDGAIALATACRRGALASLSIGGIFLTLRDAGATALRAAVEHRCGALTVLGLPDIETYCQGEVIQTY
jgi:Ran GTPase-activating protein (RanGAP) involved in mRNA processing and transport